jgi:hypothetical protein
MRKNGRDVRLSSKVDRRRFLKYIGAGAITIGGAAAAYYLYNTGLVRKEQVAISTTARTETTTSTLESTIASASTARYTVPEPRPVRCPFNISAAYLHSFKGGHPRDTWSNYHLHPLLGYYQANDPWVSDWHIKWAVEHGVNTFAVHFLEHASWGKGAADAWSLDSGLLQAKYLDYIHFYAFYDSLIWMYDVGPQSFDQFQRQTEDTVTYLCENYFAHRRYLRHENRPVLDIFSAFDYVTRFGERKFISSMDSIRSICGTYGYDVYLVGQVAEPWNHDQAGFYAKPFDALSYYNMVDAGASASVKMDKNGYPTLVAPYDSMVQGYASECKFWSAVAKKHQIGFIPSLCPAFSNRPFYETGIDHFFFERTGSTPAKFKRMCELVKAYVDPELNRLYVEAWNEFPEDSVLEPTVENGFGYIDALRDAYCEQPADGWPPDLYPTKDGIKEYSRQ